MPDEKAIGQLSQVVTPLITDKFEIEQGSSSFYESMSQLSSLVSDNINRGAAQVLNTNSTAVGNVGSGEDDLITYNIAGGTLGTNGEYIHWIATGQFGASLNNKRIRAYLGTSLLFDTGALAITAATDWSMEGEILRVDGTNQRSGARFTSSSSVLSGFSQYAAPTETLSGALTLKLTGTATSDNDIVQRTLIVEKYSAGGASGSLTVKEIDGSPSVGNVNEIKFPNSSLTDNGGGSVTFNSTVVSGRLSLGGTTYFSLPGVEPTTVTTFAMAANQVRYAPILVITPITIDQLAIEVTSAGAGGTTARLGIYNADTSWQPTTLVVDAGTVAVDSTGVKTAGISTTLQPGRYLTAINTDGAPTVRTVRGGAHYMGLNTSLGASSFNISMLATQTYAAFPATATAPTTVGSGGNPFQHYVVLRVSTP